MTIITLTATDCEACGRPGADLITYTCGATAEMCPDCLTYETRQAEIDRLAALL